MSPQPDIEERPLQETPPAPAGRGARAGDSVSEGRLTLIVAGLLLLSLLAQWPAGGVADWRQFAFYDPGTTLKGDLLLQKGYVPSVDFGYTHGLLSLMFGRAGFAVLGATWRAFLLLTLLTEMAMAWGLARLFIATRLARRKASLLFVLLALPMAIQPAYLTLTHPLEAMLILLALAEQAEGKKPRALALMTVCLFVKPSMAYVYGLVLLVLIVWERRARMRDVLRDIAPAGMVLGALMATLALRFGWMPVFRTLLPLTGARTYAATGFGFFSARTRDELWWPADKSWLIVGPGGVYLIAVGAGVIGAVGYAAGRIMRRPAAEPDGHGGVVPASAMGAPVNGQLLVTLALLHSAFLLAFYGFSGSWTYYAYMPVLALPLAVAVFVQRRRTAVFVALAVLMGLSYGVRLAGCWISWSNKTPMAAAGPGAMPGLWREPDEYAAWNSVLKICGSRPTLVLTNGYLADLPPNISMPDAWFPEPGIPTTREIARIQQQVDQAEYIVLFGHLASEGVELWTSGEFQSRRGQFEEVRTFTSARQPGTPLFVLLQRRK